MDAIRCEPDGVEISLESPVNLLDLLVGAGVPIVHACGGNARCSTCRVRVVEGLEVLGTRTEAEQRMAERLRFDDPLRLACQTEVRGAASVRRLVLDELDCRLCSQSEEAAARDAGRERFVAVLFADIEGFTPLAEELPAYDVVHILNRFFAAAGAAIEAAGGSIANTMGDGVMALFGVDGPPASTANGNAHGAAGGVAAGVSREALLAGVALLDVARSTGAYLDDAYGRGFGLRIGAHCGPAIVGCMGTHGGRRDTAIGDTVNLASRIESANKETGTRFLVSSELRRRAGGGGADVRFGRRFELALKGKRGTFEVHEVLGRGGR